MKILIAPDSYKDSLTSVRVAEIIGEEFEKAGHKVDLVPIADGGEGTVEAFLYDFGGEKKFIEVSGPLRRKVKAYYGLFEKTAFIEMAQASGIQLLTNKEKNPWLTTSYGVGELILDALDQGVDEILIGIGGSATNDGGCGMAQALGVKFYDKYGKLITGKKGNGIAACDLKNIAKIDTSGFDARVSNIKITVLCDVDNPLLGEDGAAYVYGPQKGAKADMVQKLEASLKHLSDLFKAVFFKETDFAGAGAAGGLGAGLKVFCGANLVSGIDILIDYLGLEEKIKRADLVVVGEGCMDFQTIFGKAPAGISKIAKKYNKPVIAIVGKVGVEYKNNFEILGIDHIFSCYGEKDKVKLNVIKKDAEENLRKLMKKVLDKISDLDSIKYQLTLI